MRTLLFFLILVNISFAQYLGWDGFDNFTSNKDNLIASFNGTSAYLSLTDDADFSPGTSDFTIEAWIYSDDYKQETTRIYSHLEGNNDFINLRMDGASGTLYFHVRQASTNICIINSSTVLTNGEHYYVVVSYDNDTGATLYINGASDETAGTFVADTDIDISGTLYIGSYNGSIRFWDGYMSEVRFSDVARALPYIIASYGCGISIDANHLAVWHFNSDGAKWDDRTENSHTLTNSDVEIIKLSNFVECNNYW